MPLPDSAFLRATAPGEYAQRAKEHLSRWRKEHPNWLRTPDRKGFVSPDGTQYYEVGFGETSRRQFLAGLVAIPFLAGGMAAAMHAILGEPKQQKQKSEEADAASAEGKS